MSEDINQQTEMQNQKCMQHRWRTGGCWSRNTLVRGKQRGQKLNTYRDVPLLQQETNVFHML